MEPKYVELQTVVDDILARQKAAPPLGSMGWYYTGPNVVYDETKPEPPIITEDIPCEIIEPKQLDNI